MKNMATVVWAVLTLVLAWSGPTHAQGAASSYKVEMADIEFRPSVLTVAPGDTVTWTNLDEAKHSVTSVQGSELSSLLFGKGGSFSHTFASAGTFAYVCDVHPDMKATVRVVASPVAPVLIPPFTPVPQVAVTTSTSLNPLLLVFALVSAISTAALLAMVSGARGLKGANRTEGASSATSQDPGTDCESVLTDTTSFAHQAETPST